MSERRSRRCADAATTTATRPPLASALANCTAPSLARRQAAAQLRIRPFKRGGGRKLARDS
jgi:hypothetical protein